MEETVGDITKSATHGIIEQGVTGSMMVLFFIIAAVLLWVILKDKDYQKKMAEALVDMVENQKRFNEQYKNSQEHHKEVVSLITEVTKTERSNTKECYNKVIEHQVSFDRKLDAIHQAVLK